MSLNFERKIIDFFPKNKQILHFCLIFMVFCAFSAASQSRQEQYLDYIERYKQVALEQEREHPGSGHPGEQRGPKQDGP